MFEKDAEEYVNTHVAPPFSISEQDLYDCFQKAATFGYNKANEWQYVFEKGTPKIEGHYLVCLRNKDKDIIDCWILYDKDVGWYSMQIRIKDIYAWKEIVPPKEG